MDGSVNVPGASAADLAAVRQIAENAETAANAAAAVQGNLDTHIGDTTKHITAAERTAWNGKQNALTFDDVPTSGSNNPVNSDGIAAALAAVSGDIANKVNTEDVAELWVWEKKTPATYELGAALGQKILWCSSNAGENYYARFQVSDAVSVSSDGTVSLYSPSEVTIYRQNTTTDVDYSGIIGKFFKVSAICGGVTSDFTGGEIYYCPNNAVFDAVYSEIGWNYIYVTGVQKVDGVAQTHVSYLVSSTATTYPEDGQQGDYWYTRLGQIGDWMTRVETGSYVGTGTYGADNPTSITFPFKLKLFCLYGSHRSGDSTILSSGSNNCNPILPISSLSSEYDNGLQPSINSSYAQYGYAKISDDGKTISWYNTRGENYQNNSKAIIYYYIAIG